MNVLLLAAGIGSRLKPITNRIPKCLVTLNKRPLLDYWLEKCEKLKPNKIYVNTHYLATQVEQYIKLQKWVKEIVIIKEDDLEGTAGTIVKNLELLLDEPLVVIHADNYSEIDLEEFYEYHSRMEPVPKITMALFETDNPQSCGIVKLDQFGKVVEFYEKVTKPPGILANAAIYVFSKELLQLAGQFNPKPFDISQDIIPRYMGEIATYKIIGFHQDIGTLSAYRAALEYLGKRDKK